MAKTYYKYAKRDKTVDYSSGVKELSEGLMSTVSGLEEKADKFAGEVGEAKKKVEADFEKKEAEKKAKDKTFDKKYDEAAGDVGSLSMSTQQDYKPVQAVMLELADKASKINLDLKKQYDGGKMLTSDFNIITDNIANQFRMMKQASITTLDMVTRTNKGMKDGTTLPIQHDMLMDVFRSSFSNPNAKIDFDKDGNVMQTVTDPKTGKTTTRSIYDIQKLSMQEFDVFDVDAETKSLVDNIGATLENERILNGQSLTTEELLDMEIMQDGTTFNKPMDLVDAEINGYNENQLASILQMKMGANYKRSTDGGDFGDDEIIVYEDQGPTKGGQYAAHLTDNQKTVARDFARAQVLARLNPLKKHTTTGNTSDYDKKETKRIGDEKEQAGSYVDALKMLFLAKDKPERERAMRMLGESIGQDRFSSMEMNAAGDAMTLTTIDDDGKARPRVIKFDGTLRDFIETAGPTLTGLKKEDAATRWKYIDEVLDEDSGNKTATTHQGSYDIGYVFGPKTQKLMDYNESAANIDRLIKGVKQGWRTSEGEAFQMYEDAVNSSLSSMGAQGLVVVRSGSRLSIKLPEGKVVAITLNESSETKSKVANILKAIHTALSKGDEAALDGLITAEGGASQFNTQ
jgi:hypothetical protein